MSGLPSEILTICRQTLCRCREFENYQTLRSIFVTDELIPFRIGLRSADTPEALVDLCIDHLLQKRLLSGKPVLLIFVTALYKRYEPGDALHNDLEDLHNILQQAMGEAIPQSKQSSRRKQMLFDRLLQLDFRPQVRIVREVIDKHRVAAFLIHGPPDHGQRMLAYRLARLKPEWETGQHITIDAGSNGTGKSSRSLWNEVAKRLQMPSWTPVHDLVDKVSEWLQTQDVLFTFHTVDYMPPDLLSTWIKEFWGPLVTMAIRHQYQTQRPTHLLLYLTDYTGHVCRSNIPFRAYDSKWQPDYMPLLLPPAGPFPPLELEIWIDAATEVLPSGLPVSMLLSEPYRGIPELVYEKICQHCGISWEGELAR